MPGAGILLGFAYWTNLWAAAGMGGAGVWVACGFVGLSAALLAWAPRQRRRVAVSLLLFFLAGACLLVAAALLSDGVRAESTGYRWTRFVGLMLLCVAAINVGAVVLFDVLLGAVRLNP